MSRAAPFVGCARARVRLQWCVPCVLLLWLCIPVEGCFWAPDIASQGYTACTNIDDCAAGRICEMGICAPPAWHDEGFGSRQLFVVRNPSGQDLPAGTPIPIRVGANGLLQSQELGVDGRFVFFAQDSDAWEILPSYRDVYEDFLNVYLPLPESVPASEQRQLAWLETRTESGLSNYLEDPDRIFHYFDDFIGNELSSTRYSNFGTGVPTVEDNRVRVADNQRLVGKVPFSQPFSFQARARINGVNCRRFFIGLTASDGVSYAAPSAGFFSNEALEVLPEIAPTQDSVPRPVAAPAELSTAEHRLRIDIGEGRARFWVDDLMIAEPELRPAFEDTPLHLRVEVDGECSVEVERFFVSKTPIDVPVVQAEPRVDYEIFR